MYDGFLDIALEWCYKKNCGFGPEDFCYSSNVKPWWRCSRNPKLVFE
ncbi:MAG: zinc-ribbon domain-containing protein [Candidatus Melainabacteria bacterium]|nr:zinc-ribbon domain-containing protein [Candidatus Melainabacteria bacterium]